MKAFSFCYRLGNILNSIESYFEASLSTVKAIYFDPIFDLFMALRAYHFFRRLFKARDVKKMFARSH